MINTDKKRDDVEALFFGYWVRDLAIWLPIAKVTWDKKYYYYSYTDAFKESEKSSPELASMILNPDFGFNQPWVTENLHPFLATKVPKRADSLKVYDLLGLKEQKGDFISYFARNGSNLDSHFDIFPQVKVDTQGYYNYYFPLVDLASLIIDSESGIKEAIDSLSATSKLDLIIDQEKVNIYYQDLYLGSCPEYIRYLLSIQPRADYEINIHQINKDEEVYAYQYLIKVSIAFSIDPYSSAEMQPVAC